MTTGQDVRIGRLGLGQSWLRPQVRAWDVSVAGPNGERIAIERIRVHPAVSTSWLRGDPALVVALRSALGEIDGTVVLGAQPAFDGTLRGVALALLPLQDVAPGLSLDGKIDADLDVAVREAGTEGSVAFEAKDGSLTMPVLPIGLPFEKLTGTFELGGESLVKVDAFDLQGPVIALTASGTVGKGATSDLAPLALTARIEAREPAVRSLLSSQGVALDANGTAAVEIQGTLGSPSFVPARGDGRAG
jgi:type II secretion system protein N